MPEINCDSFCVNSIIYDTADPNHLFVSIDNNDSNFINYPIVQLIDLLGDTVANQQRSFDFYGQGPHTVQIYHIVTTLNSFPANWTGQVRLEDGLFHIACIINFPCGNVNTAIPEKISALGFTIYPNPASETLIMESDVFATSNPIPVMHDFTGRTVNADYTRDVDKYVFDTKTLAAGAYFVELNIHGKAIIKKFVKID